MLMEEQFTVFILNRTRGEKMNNDDEIFVYLCPICKTPNPKSVKYGAKWGHGPWGHQFFLTTLK